MLDLFYSCKNNSGLLPDGKSRKFNNIKSGFTLVEVIITLSIAAIVASLAIPSLIGYIDTSKEKAAVTECRSVVTAAQYLANDEYDENGTTGASLVSHITEAEILKLAEEENTSDSSLAKMLSFDFSIGIKAYADDESYTYGNAYDDITVIENKAVPEDKSGKSFIESYEFEGYTLSHMIYLSKNGIWLEYKAQGKEIPVIATVTTSNNSYSVVFKNGNKIISIKNYNSGESVTPPEVKKDGFTLKGWNLEKGDTKSSLGPTEAFTVSGSEKKIIYKAVLEGSSVTEPSTEPTTNPETKPDKELPGPIESGGQLFTIVKNMVDQDNWNSGVNGELSNGVSNIIFEYGGDYYFFPYMQMFYNPDENWFSINGEYIYLNQLGLTSKEDIINYICRYLLTIERWGATSIKLNLTNTVKVSNDFGPYNTGSVIASDGLIAITEDETKAYIYVAGWYKWEQIRNL